MGLLSGITNAFKGPLLGGGKGGGNSLMSLFSGLFGGGDMSGAITSAVLPPALNMLFSGSSMSQPIPAPATSSGVAEGVGASKPGSMGQAATNGSLPNLPANQAGAEFTPMAAPRMMHSMPWYAGDPNAPAMQQSGQQPMSAGMMPKRRMMPSDFNQYFQG